MDHDAADRAMLVRPSDWFSTSDAERFAYHGDPRFDECMNALRAQWIDPGLPLEPPPNFDESLHATVYIPDDVVAHVEALRASRLE